MTNALLSSILGAGPLAANARHLPATAPAGAAGSFMDMIGAALRQVSSAQQQASSTQAAYAAGLPGARLGAALVSSDRAEVAWNATVAVRNEVVSAYQTIMNMPL